MNKERIKDILNIRNLDYSKGEHRLQVLQDMQRLIREANPPLQTAMLKEVLDDWMKGKNENV